MVNLDIKKLPEPIRYGDKIFLVGSCFTEHIGNSLEELKFPVLQNPNGILFDSSSVCRSLISYIENKQYKESDLFQLNEVWHSWQHHSRFSNVNSLSAIESINDSQKAAHAFLKEADWMIITLGSSFSYLLRKDTPGYNSVINGYKFGDGEGAAGVANCHRAPGQWFDKHLLSIQQTISMMDTCYHRLLQFNPNLKIIFTVSPVRHIRDGVVENNRSKARLIEAIHHMVNKFERLYYFPAYELVIDVLRDYRFYDIDLAHPNYSATSYVLEKFSESCIDDSSRQLMEEVKKIIIARKHKAFQPQTEAHRQFLRAHAEKATELMQKHSFLNLEDELQYFTSIGR